MHSTVMRSDVLTLRLSNSVNTKLERLARVMRRTKTSLATEAIRKYLAVNEWHIEEIKKALREADSGNFASSYDVQSVMNKWTNKNTSR